MVAWTLAAVTVPARAMAAAPAEAVALPTLAVRLPAAAQPVHDSTAMAAAVEDAAAAALAAAVDVAVAVADLIIAVAAYMAEEGCCHAVTRPLHLCGSTSTRIQYLAAFQMHAHADDGMQLGPHLRRAVMIVVCMCKTLPRTVQEALPAPHQSTLLLARHKACRV